MTTEIDALLAYGYDLGGPGRWRVHGADNQYNPFPWWSGASSGDAFETVAHEKLREARRTRFDVDVVGINIVWYGSEVPWTAQGTGYILAAACLRRFYSGARLLSSGQLDVDAAWNNRLLHAITVLDIRPLQPVGWHLAASYGI